MEPSSKSRSSGLELEDRSPTEQKIDPDTTGGAGGAEWIANPISRRRSGLRLFDLG
jgi:hypothetical protein